MSPLGAETPTAAPRLIPPIWAAAGRAPAQARRARARAGTSVRRIRASVFTALRLMRCGGPAGPGAERGDNDGATARRATVTRSLYHRAERFVRVAVASQEPVEAGTP